MKGGMRFTRLISRISMFAAVFAGATLARAETFRRADVEVVGPIEYGQPSSPVRYTGKPRFRAFEFNAKAGDHIEATVLTKRGTMQAYLTDVAFHELAGGSSHFTATIPESSAPSSYYILVAEADGRAAVFTLQLERPSNADHPAGAEQSPATPVADYLSCSNDSDCVAVERAGCCRNGWKDAVNKDRVGDYAQANACKQRGTMCPQFIVNDDRVAACDTTKRQCVMVKR